MNYFFKQTDLIYAEMHLVWYLFLFVQQIFLPFTKSKPKKTPAL